MCQFSGTVLQARQISLSGHFLHSCYVSWNHLGLFRSLLDLCFINALHLSTWATYKVQLNRWKANNWWFRHFTPERNMHTSAIFKDRAQLIYWISKETKYARTFFFRKAKLKQVCVRFSSQNNFIKNDVPLRPGTMHICTEAMPLVCFFS